MRLVSALALGFCGVAAIAAGVNCSAGGNGGGKTSSSGAGGTTSGPGAGPSTGPFGQANTTSGFGGLIGTSAGVTGAGGFAVPDDDKTNPNITHPICGIGKCPDFPATPLVDTGVPDGAAALFGDPANFTAGSLCALEPQLSGNGVEGAMLPANWVRPRFRVAAPAGIDLFEIRIHSPAEANDLVAYTKSPTWYLPKDIWSGTAAESDAGYPSGVGLANNAAGLPLTVTIRGVNSASPGTPVGIQGDFNIAPVVATGSMVFWTVNSAAVTPDSSKLLGFAVGDEGVANTLTLTNIAWGGEIGESGNVLRGFYDKTKLPGFVDGQVRCMGCHTSTPDGQAVVFTDDWPWSKAAATITNPGLGSIPPYISPGAQSLMKMPWWGTQTMSKAHFTTGDRYLVTSYATTFMSGTSRTAAWQGLPAYAGNNGATADDKVKWHQLAWINLESTTSVDVAVTDTPDYNCPAPPATCTNTTDGVYLRETAAAAARGTGWGLLATGDSGISDVTPSMSHGTLDQVAYTATDFSPDGHPDATAKVADVKIVPYNNHAGGTATPLAGASDPAFLEYYPSFSADDKLIAFTRAPTPSASSPDGPYYNRFGEVMVIPAGGGTPVHIAANDPNTCAGDNTAAGIINSWPKWSPDVFVAHGKTYYFLIFSSARKYGDEFSQQFSLPANPLSAFQGLNTSSQLYLAAVVVDNTTGAMTTYPAVYIWNQNRVPTGTGGIQYSNLTPAWDAFALPPLVIPDVTNPPPPH